jgi:hypothetical protein
MPIRPKQKWSIVQFFHKKIIMKGTNFFTHRLGSTKVYQKEKKKVRVVF